MLSSTQGGNNLAKQIPTWITRSPYFPPLPPSPPHVFSAQQQRSPSTLSQTARFQWLCISSLGRVKVKALWLALQWQRLTYCFLEYTRLDPTGGLLHSVLSSHKTLLPKRSERLSPLPFWGFWLHASSQKDLLWPPNLTMHPHNNAYIFPYTLFFPAAFITI